MLQVVSHLLEHVAAHRLATGDGNKQFTGAKTKTLSTEQGGGGVDYSSARSGLTPANVPGLLQALPLALASLGSREMHRDQHQLGRLRASAPSLVSGAGGGSSSESGGFGGGGVSGGTMSSHRTLREQLVVLFVNFALRALDYGPRRAEQWASALSDLAPTLGLHWACHVILVS
jgi:hypothetical protein